MATMTAARAAASALGAKTETPAPRRPVGLSRAVRARPRRALAEDRDVSKLSSPGRPRTLGWGRKRGSVGPDEDLLADPDTHGYCVYSHADWSYAYKSVAGEFDSIRDGGDVVGTIPDELIGGVLYRNGPGLFERGGREYNHMLDGDGYVLRFEFSDAKTARFASRFVRTKEFRAEEEADDVLYRGTFGTMRAGGPLRNALDLHQKNLANTNILAWGGKVYALYEAGRPVELDPKTLETVGEVDLNGRLSGGMFVSVGAPSGVESALGIGGKAFTAHPHVDPNTGRVVGWGWTSAVAKRSVEATFWEWDKNWGEVASTEYSMSGCEAAPHDFAVTESWYVMIQNCLRVDPLLYLAGVKGAGECLVSQPEDPVTVHLIPRRDAGFDGGADKSGRAAVAAAGPRESFEIHVAFAHDGPPLDANRRDVSDSEMKEWVTAYTAGWEKLEPGSFLGEWSQSAGWDFDIATSLSPDFNNIPRTLLWRYRINARTGTVFREPAPGCEDLCIDHPHVNPMFEGRRECRYVYASISNEVRCSGPPLGYVRIDVATGKTQRWWAGNRTFCEEVVLVPKKGSDGSPGSDDRCWVLGMCVAHDAEGAGRSSLVVLDGEDLGKGPVARVWLDNQIPHGLHGMFVPA